MAKLNRFLLLANVKAARATAGHRIQRPNPGVGINSMIPFYPFISSVDSLLDRCLHISPRTGKTKTVSNYVRALANNNDGTS